MTTIMDKESQLIGTTISDSMSRRPQPQLLPSSEQRRPSQDVVDSAALFLERRRSSEQTIGTIQPDLYRRRGSVVTQNSDKGVTSIGRVQLKLGYDYAKSDFVVTLLDVQETLNLDEYYLVVKLSDEDDKMQRRESLRRRRSKPTNENGCTTTTISTETEQQQIQHFKFAITYDELLERRLIVQLFDAGRIGRNAYQVGEFGIDISSLDPSAEVVVWADIDSKPTIETYGQLLIALTYLPSVDRLTLTIHQARDLTNPKSPDGRSADPYVKVTLMQDGKVIKKRKTSVRKNTLSPVWNEALSFNVSDKSLIDMKTTRLEVCVMDYDLIGNDQLLGYTIIGADSRDSKAQFLWDDIVMSRGRQNTPTWLVLQLDEQKTNCAQV